MTAPTAMLWLYALAECIATGLRPSGEGISKHADLAGAYGLGLVISAWVMADARKRRRELCYDYDSFVFFAWPFLVPVYLFQTRGARAFLTLLCFAGIWLIAATMVALIQEFAWT